METLTESIGLIVCKNDRCVNIVPTRKTPGRPKEFCSTRCRKRFNARQNYERETGAAGSGLIRIVNGYPQVFRKKAPSLKAAQTRFHKHLEDCSISDGPICKARLWDVYDRKKACLIHAVLGDDWGYWLNEVDHKTYQRKTTTEDGYWISDAEKLVAAGIRTTVEPEVDPRVAAFLEAGGGKTGDLWTK